MEKTMNFTIDGKAYTLSFTRATIIQTENMGFSLQKIYDQPVGMLDILWKGAFLAHHDTLTIGEVESLFEKIKKSSTDKDSNERLGLMDALIALYKAPVESLFDADEDNEKNVVEWTIN